MMTKIVVDTHIFIYQVCKFNNFSILQKGKGNHNPNPLLPCLGIPPLLDPGPHSVAQEQAIDNEHIISILK